MKKVIVAVACSTFLLLAGQNASAAECVSINKGTIKDSTGNVIEMGFDQYGYNYQAHIFNGLSDNYSRPAVPVETGLDSLVMKWSDDWLSNKDCNGDGKLDRGLDPKTGLSTGISQGWVTNHYEGDYEEAGEFYHYTEFIKIVFVGVAPVAPATDPWAATRIWDQYAIIEDVFNDIHGGFHGVDKNTLANPAGLGFYTN